MKRIFNKCNVISFLITVVLSLIIVFCVYRLWEIDTNIPPLFKGDGVLGMIISTSIEESGIMGNFFIDRMGAPGISPIVDSPFVDLMALVEEYVISIITDSAADISHWFYYLSFPLVAATMYVLLSKFTEDKVTRIFFSVAYAITPFHFMRGFKHASLSNYYIIPITLYIVLLLVEEEYTGITPNRYKNNRVKRITYILSCIAIGCSNIYYAFISLICLVLAVIFKIIKNSKISYIWHEGLTVIISLISVGIGLFPNILYIIVNGANSSSVVRSGNQTEFYSLKFIQLLIPPSYDRISFLSHINEVYFNESLVVNENTYASLGIIGVVGICILIAWIVYTLATGIVGKSIAFSESKIKLTSIDVYRLRLLGFIVLVLILYATAGGFGTIFSYIINPVFRSINRVSIYIACCSICAIVIFVRRIKERYSDKFFKIITAIVAILVGTLVIYSETPKLESGYQKEMAELDSELRMFFCKVENSLELGDMVYSLPYLKFPEGKFSEEMGSYDSGLGYIYTKNIRWSFGGIEGRNEDAKHLYVDDGASIYFVKNILANGFKGVLIDRNGYEDDKYLEVINFYSYELGLTPIMSDDERFVFYNLKSLIIE